MLTPTLDIQRSGNIGAQETVKMRLDENSLDFLMTILSDLYSDPQLAVIREYSVNAWDSHVEAGVTDPIVVNTPTALHPYFVVQDFGIGLSLDDIRRVYSAYGASTKRETNEQTGMLGLGSKSGLTISGQFTVTAIKDGKKAQVLVSRTETGGGSMDIVSVTDTTERNGVTISIPVGHNSYGFEQKAKEFFKFWKPGRVLLNGREPEFIKGDVIAPGITVYDSNEGYRTKDYVVMGGVSYPVDSNYRGHAYNGFGVMFDVNIGDVHFTPSREQLHYTTVTKNTLKRLYDKFRQAFAAHVSKDIEAAADNNEALIRMVKWMSRLGHSRIPSDWTFRGQSIPSTLGPYRAISLGNITDEFSEIYLNILSMNGLSNYRYSTQGNFAMIIKDFPMEKLSSYAKGRINKFREIHYGVPMVISDDPEMDKDPWLANCKRITWKDILDATRQPSTRSNAPVFNADNEFHVFAQDPTTQRYGWKVEAVPAGKKFYYFEPKDYPKQDYGTLAYLCKTLDCVLVKVYARRAERFKKVHPNAEHLRNVRDALQAVYDAKVSEADKFHNASDTMYFSVRWLDAEQVDDPKLKKFIELSKTPRTNNNWVRDAQFHLDKLGLPLIKEEGGKLDLSHLDNYPLMISLDAYRAKQDRTGKYMDHVYDYLNNTYAKMAEESN